MLENINLYAVFFSNYFANLNFYPYLCSQKLLLLSKNHNRNLLLLSKMQIDLVSPKSPDLHYLLLSFLTK